MTRLLTGVAGRRAQWSPDGRRLYFDAVSSSNPVTLFVAEASGGEARQIGAARTSQYAGTWSRDGGRVVIADLTPTDGFDLVSIDVTGTTAPQRLLGTPANETAPAFSPDGRWLALVSDTTGREEVFLLPASGGGTPLQVSREGGREPVWSRRGDELFFRRGPEMLAARMLGSAPPRIAAPVLLFTGEFDRRPMFHPNYDVAADGRFLMVRGTAPDVTDTRVAVLLNWATPPR